MKTRLLRRLRFGGLVALCAVARRDVDVASRFGYMKLELFNPATEK